LPQDADEDKKKNARDSEYGAPTTPSGNEARNGSSQHDAQMEMTLSANRSEPSGRLRVSAPVLIGRLLIAPQLPAFLARHPLVDIDLD
jgi:DNA-binding transcriptional LysR family regulator